MIWNTLTTPPAEVLAQITEWASNGVKQESMARALGMSTATWSTRKKLYPELEEAIQQGKAKAEIEVTGLLMKMVRSGDKASIFFYLKTQCKWRESSEVTVNQPTRKPSGIAPRQLNQADVERIKRGDSKFGDDDE